MRNNQVGRARSEPFRQALVVVDGTEIGDGVAGGNDRPLLLLLHPLPPALLLGHDAVGPHADGVTLFESAGLALPPHVHVDLTVVAVLAQILGALALSDAAPEEAFAALAGQGVVVVAGGPVATDKAEFFLRPRSRPLGVAAAWRTEGVGMHRVSVVLDGAEVDEKNAFFSTSLTSRTNKLECSSL